MGVRFPLLAQGSEPLDSRGFRAFLFFGVGLMLFAMIAIMIVVVNLAIDLAYTLSNLDEMMVRSRDGLRIEPGPSGDADLIVTGLLIIGIWVLIYLNAFARLATLFTFVL